MITPLDCRQLVELVTDYLEGALGPDERTAVTHHLDECDGCDAYVAQMRETIRLTGSLSADDISDEACAALLAAFVDAHRRKP